MKRSDHPGGFCWWGGSGTYCNTVRAMSSQAALSPTNGFCFWMVACHQAADHVRCRRQPRYPLVHSQLHRAAAAVQNTRMTGPPLPPFLWSKASAYRKTCLAGRAGTRTRTRTRITARGYLFPINCRMLSSEFVPLPPYLPFVAVAYPNPPNPRGAVRPTDDSAPES